MTPDEERRMEDADIAERKCLEAEADPCPNCGGPVEANISASGGIHVWCVKFNRNPFGQNGCGWMETRES